MRVGRAGLATRPDPTDLLGDFSQEVGQDFLSHG